MSSEIVEVDGADEARRRIMALPKVASKAMREAAREIVDDEVPRIKRAAAGDRVSQLVAGAIRTRSDRFPTIVAGGSKKLAPSRKIHRSRTEKTKSGRGKLVKPSAGELFFGAEFGGRRRKTTRQFRAHKGKEGYWFWPTLRADAERIGDQWVGAIDQVEKEFTS